MSLLEIGSILTCDYIEGGIRDIVARNYSRNFFSGTIISYSLSYSEKSGHQSGISKAGSFHRHGSEDDTSIDFRN